MTVEQAPQQTSEPWKKTILLLIIVNTLLGAIVAYLQNDASIRSSQANINSQYYSILASGELLRSSIQGTYDVASYGEVLKNTQESLVFQYTALDEASKGNLVGSDLATLESSIQLARAERARLFSIFYTDPRYAPKTPDGTPNVQSYLADQAAYADSMVTKQNVASDNYHLWSKKADIYVAILTILSIAFFLLGLGQSLAARVRLLFAAVGLFTMIIAGFWCLITIIG